MSLFTFRRDRNKFRFLSIEAVNYCNSTTFRQHLYLEIRRSEREKYTFSIILINIAGVNGHVQETGGECRLRKCLIEICDNIRETDSVCCQIKEGIGILLPNTSLPQAEQVFQRIRRQVVGILKSDCRDIMARSNVTILTYPPDHPGNRHSNTRHQERHSSAVDVCELITDLVESHTNGVMNGDNLVVSRINSPTLFHEIHLLKLCVKRLLDIAGALFGIVIASPLLFGVAIVIKLTSHGPVLFKQQRVGLKGKRFTMLKFRSMHVEHCSKQEHKALVTRLMSNSTSNAVDPGDVQVYQTHVDQRITPVGKFIRRTSIDELPQLFNILKGDMSLVGPRPHPEYEVELYEPWYFRRLLVKPGLTGFSKVKLRCSLENYSEAMRFDIRYVDGWSLWQDFKILLKTVPLLLLQQGAY